MNPATKYRLRALNPEILFDNQNRQQAKSLIELIPADRPYFEIISFIEFCYASEKQFSSSDVIKRNDKNIEIFLFIKNPINTFQSTNYAFHVLISQNLLFIKLFVKNLLNNLRIIEENDDIFIEFNNDEIKIDELICPSGTLSNCSLITKVANYFTDNRHPCPICARKLFFKYSKKADVKCSSWIF